MTYVSPARRAASAGGYDPLSYRLTDSPDFRPSGVPLGRSLLIRPGIANDDLRAAVAAIERVHGDGVLPPIPVEFVGWLGGDETAPVDGRFSFSEAADGSIVPAAIFVRHDAPHRGLVLVHEIGHFLDACGFPGRGFSSISPDRDELDGWRGAVVATRAFEALLRLRDRRDVRHPGRLDVLRQGEELWARSYAQFVAVSSDSRALRNGIALARRRPPSGVYYPVYWDDDDFRPVASAIEALFRRLGWITSPTVETSNGRTSGS